MWESKDTCIGLDRQNIDDMVGLGQELLKKFMDKRL